MAAKVSVIMSVYNTKECYLRKSIESILNQTFSDFEFIIVLDCPTDGSEKIICEYKNKDSRIVVLKNTNNLGLTKSLNYALSLASGNYIARMDSDDFAVPYRLAKQCEYLDLHPDVGVVGGHVYTGVSGTRSMTAWNRDTEITRIHMLFHNAGVPHPTAMFRRILEDNYELKYDEKILKSQDYALWASVANRTKIVVMNEVFLIYRIHENQISAMPEGQAKYSSMVIAEQLKATLDVRNSKVIELVSSIYFGKNKIACEDLYQVCEYLIGINDKVHAFNLKKFKHIVKEIQFESLYIKMFKEKESRFNIWLGLIRRANPLVLYYFLQAYILPKINHDRLVRKFEKTNKELIDKI